MIDQSDKPVILVIEDDPLILELIRDNLTKDGFVVLYAQTAQGGLEILATTQPDAIVLDIALPGMDGFELCRRIRQNELELGLTIAHLPILMLTARALDQDVLTGFDAGADDYMIKPFNPLHLTARLKAIIRRSQDRVRSDGILQIHSLSLEVATGVVRCGDSLLDLAPLERKLLSILASYPGKVFSREILLQQVWEWSVEESLQTRTVDVQINRLRTKLAQADPNCADLIKTVRGIGYVIDRELIL